MSSPLQQKCGVESYQGFLFLENLEEGWNSNYAIVSNFEGASIESQVLWGTENFNAVKTLIDQNLKTFLYQDVQIRELVIPVKNSEKISLFWVGQKAYPTQEEAQKAVDRALAEGVSPKEMVEHEEEVPEIAPQSAIPSETQSTSTEGLDQAKISQGQIPSAEATPYPLHVDEKIKQVAIPGTEVEPEQDRFYWQTFGEFTWRRTNLDAPNKDNPDYFNDVVGFHSLRLIMRGMRFYEGGPTLDPYVEATFSMATNDTPFENKLVAVAGVEYRLLDNIAVLKQNPWLEWLTSLRLFGQYMDLSHLRQTDTAATTYDARAGMGLYKDWGWDKPFDQEEREPFYHYLWGELFMENAWKKTDFNREDYNSMTWSDVAWFGLKFPWIGDIPPLMPYAKVEFTASQRDFFFQNRVFFGYGLRYMPFHTSRFKGSEWLYNFKIFAEYDDIESYFKDEPPDDRPDWDFRVGVKIDINRF
ncbi:MAG: hypothetical protein HYZ67_07205 [Chlamydiae bacterium]|nr:hypothetical protein [Chlamydiota bacterium]